MATKTTITKTAKLFKPGHTAVIFCHNPKLPQMLYWELTNPMENTKWCEIIPSSENDNIIKDMESWKQDHETEWYLLNLERISQCYENLTNTKKFIELLFAINEFAKNNHLKMIVSFPTHPTANDLNSDSYEDLLVSLFSGWVNDWSTQKRQQHNLTFMSMTGKDPITLTVGTAENNCGTIEYKINNKGHLIEQ